MRGGSQPLDVGRRQRLVTGPLRRALIARDRGCVAPGCDRPPEWYEAHHLVHWANGGATSLDNTALLCGYHHTLVHQGKWTARMIDGVPHFVPPHGSIPQGLPGGTRFTTPTSGRSGEDGVADRCSVALTTNMERPAAHAERATCRRMRPPHPQLVNSPCSATRSSAPGAGTTHGSHTREESLLTRRATLATAQRQRLPRHPHLLGRPQEPAQAALFVHGAELGVRPTRLQGLMAGASLLG
ncbi:HNH endonuclease signature motif containing protein [Actinophytocola glycyrrhizae]|uniref:HNH endonuclease signature motif containing protein n=1 Tax=Actinophytocola glycyrrhizae TaxID=2044873 RepID=A0ABV9RZM1_9PSEU